MLYLRAPIYNGTVYRQTEAGNYSEFHLEQYSLAQQNDTNLCTGNLGGGPKARSREVPVVHIITATGGAFH
jgi:hypothetical protein